MPKPALQRLFIAYFNRVCALPDDLGTTLQPRELLQADWRRGGTELLPPLQRHCKVLTQMLRVPADPLELYDIAVHLPLVLAVPQQSAPSESVAVGLVDVLEDLTLEATETYLRQAFFEDGANGRDDVVQAVELIYATGELPLRRRLAMAWLRILEGPELGPSAHVAGAVLYLLAAQPLPAELRAAAEAQVRRLVLYPAVLRPPGVTERAVRAALALGLDEEEGVRAGFVELLGDRDCGLVVCEALAKGMWLQAAHSFAVLLSSWGNDVLEEAMLRQLAGSLLHTDRMHEGRIIPYLEEQAEEQAAVGSMGLQNLLQRVLDEIEQLFAPT